MELSNNDRQTLRVLAEEIADIASLPYQKNQIRLWKNLNALKPERPLVMIDQLPWNELEADNTELIPQCTEEFLRTVEREMRRLLYQWKNFKADMVVEPYWPLTKVVDGDPYNTFPGFEICETTIGTDLTSEVMSHRYNDQIKTWDDIEKIGIPKLSLNEALTKEREDILEQAFGDILPLKIIGHTIAFRVWDELATLRGVTNILYDLAERPDFLHAIMKKATSNILSIKDQLTELGAHGYAQSVIHCSGAFIEDLPSPDFSPAKPSPKDSWTCGQAQLFSSVSPDMHYEFDIQYANRFYKDYGHVYYGCCEPLDYKMDVVKHVNNLRKISISPWASAERAAEQIEDRFVYSAKPNPSMLAWNSFEIDSVKEEIRHIIKICKANGTSVEFILKDVSTVKYESSRIRQWEQAVMQIVQDNI